MNIKSLCIFLLFFDFVKYLKVRLFCIKDYQQVPQEKKCCSEAAGYSSWSASALLPHLRWELQILAPGSCEFWVGVTDSFAEQGAHAVQKHAPQLTGFNLCAIYSYSSHLNCEMSKNLFSGGEC